MEKRPLLISECLLGVACRYDGGSKGLDEATLQKLMARWHLVPVCPESLGGLPAPREPSERRDGRVFARDGREVTAQYLRGAKAACRLASLFGADTALLKERSPSCGHGRIYDGSFTGTLTDGDGVTAQALGALGVRIYGESEIDALL